MDKEIEETTSEETVEEEVEVVEEETTEEQEPSEADVLLEKNRKLFERAKKAETDNKTLKQQLEDNQSTDTDDYQETDGKVGKQVAELSAKLLAMEEKAQLDAIYLQYPVLKDKIEEFDEFKQDYPASKLASAAKLFLIEHDLLGESPKRKGLEPAKGGHRVPPKTGKMSSDDVKRLRENNWNEYLKQVKAGTISVD